MVSQAEVDGVHENAEALSSQAVDLGLDANACLRQTLAMGFHQVGSLVAEGKFPLPGIIKSGDAVETAHNVLEPAQTGNQNRKLIGLIVLRPTEASQDKMEGSSLGRCSHKV